MNHSRQEQRALTAPHSPPALFGNFFSFSFFFRFSRFFFFPRERSGKVAKYSKVKVRATLGEIDSHERTRLVEQQQKQQQ